MPAWTIWKGLRFQLVGAWTGFRRAPVRQRAQQIGTDSPPAAQSLCSWWRHSIGCAAHAVLRVGSLCGGPRGTWAARRIEPVFLVVASHFSWRRSGEIGQPAAKPAVRSLPGAGRSGRRRRPRQEERLGDRAPEPENRSPLFLRALHYSVTDSPCWVMSRPSSSSCSEGRRPTSTLTIIRITNEATAVQMMVARMPTNWVTIE